MSRREKRLINDLLNHSEVELLLKLQTCPHGTIKYLRLAHKKASDTGQDGKANIILDRIKELDREYANRDTSQDSQFNFIMNCKAS